MFCVSLTNKGICAIFVWDKFCGLPHFYVRAPDQYTAIVNGWQFLVSRAKFSLVWFSLVFDWALFRTINVDQRGGKTESEGYQRLLAMTIWTGYVGSTLDQRLWFWTRPTSNPRLNQTKENLAQHSEMCSFWRATRNVCISFHNTQLPGFEYRHGHVRKSPVTWG